MSERNTGSSGFSPRSLARASLARIGSGRAATPAAYAHLGLEPPEGEAYLG
mgnify:CR=1 FL=1